MIGQFHHIGVATDSIERDELIYHQLGYEREGSLFTDDIQGVRGLFIVGPGPRLELLEKYGESTTLEPWLRAGSRMYHQAFEVNDLSGAIGMVKQNLRARVLRPPLPAAAFEGRTVSFLVLPTRMIIELIQAEVK